MKMNKTFMEWEKSFSVNSVFLPEPAFDKMPIRQILRRMEDSNKLKFVDTQFLPLV